MLIVDYAESRQDDVVWLAEKLIRRSEAVPKPARLVLISRGSGVWWRELLLKTQSLQECSLGGDSYDEVEIPEDISRGDRRALFDAAVRAFVPYRDALGAQARAPREPAAELVRALEADSDYDRPLAVQIVALLYVAGADAAEGSQGMAGLLAKILGLEYEHWEKTLKIGGQANWQAAIKHGVAQMTLAGGVASAEAAEALIRSDPLYRNVHDVDVPRVCQALSLIFPGDNEGLAGLEPDLVGEHHAARVITDPLLDGCLDWAGDDRAQRRHILTVLNRATRAEHGAEADRAAQQLERMVGTKVGAFGADLVKVALETPGRLLDVCPALEAQLGSLDDGSLAAIDAELPLQSLTLMELSLAVAVRRAELARNLEAAAAAATDVPLDTREQILNLLAARVDNLGIRLSDLGRREEALAASEEAVDIRRRLAQTRPDAFLPDLAASLNNLGATLSNLGRREEALAASQQAVNIRRRLVQTRPDAFLPDLASSLNNLGGDLSNLGRREEALVASQEAVDIYRRLAQTRPDAFLPTLATSLNNLGAMLSNLGRREEALAASQEAVDIRRRLAQTRPEAFLPDLASSLNNLGSHLSNLGRRDEALAASQEAVDIYRRLAQTRPDAFLPDFATSLGALGVPLTMAERHAEAADAWHEGLAAIAPFVKGHPQAFGNLAGALRRGYLEACDQTGAEADAALLERVVRAIGDDEIGMLKRKVAAILEATAGSGALDETALAELPTELADQLRKRWAEKGNELAGGTDRDA